MLQKSDKHTQSDKDPGEGLSATQYIVVWGRMCSLAKCVSESVKPNPHIAVQTTALFPNIFACFSVITISALG